MSRIITFSRYFPAYHPRKGEPTYFREKIWAGLADTVQGFEIPHEITDWDWHQYYNAVPELTKGWVESAKSTKIHQIIGPEPFRTLLVQMFESNSSQEIPRKPLK